MSLSPCKGFALPRVHQATMPRLPLYTSCIQLRYDKRENAGIFGEAIRVC